VTYYVLAGITYLFSLIVKKKLDATYRKWGSVRNSAGITGAGTARRILDANEMRRVPVEAVPGKLSDHYDPRAKTLRLSESVYSIPSVASLAIAAHEAGHAIQDHVDYRPMELRTFAVPIAHAGARFGLPAAIAGSFLGIPWLVQAGVLAYMGALGIQFLTLPVEFNASKRALQQVEALNLVNEAEEEGARSVLRAAAMTYVAGVASSAGYVLYLAFVAGRSLFRRPPAAKPRPPA
jgi:Zn-dependent membrane protease YugP